MEHELKQSVLGATACGQAHGKRFQRDVDKLGHPFSWVETKQSILGATASGVCNDKRFQKDIDERDHPFSWAETKPLPLWQRTCEHHGLTHIVDFTPGSAMLAIAAAGTIQYEGIATNDAHRGWLDSVVDRVMLYLVGQNKQVATNLGCDENLSARVDKFLSGTSLEAHCFLEPINKETCSESSDEDLDA